MWLVPRFFVVLIFLLTSSACAERSYTPVMSEALSVGQPVTVFAGTIRAQEKGGQFGYNRSKNLRHLELTVSIPPSHQPGTLNFGYARPNPHRQFTLAGQHVFSNSSDFKARLRRELARRPANEREVTIFVHGYNTTQNETVFRAAQIAHDISLPGPTVIYSWPSRGKALAYAYDNDSVLFARDGLERLLRQISETGARRILLVAHSIGSTLTMETLRQIDIDSPGWPARNLAGVVLISPDLDVEVFRSQMQRISRVPEPFLIFVSHKDKVLNLSARLRGTSQQDRLGNIQNSEMVADLPVQVIDTTAFSDGAESSHFVPATSPALIALIRKAASINTTFRDEQITITSVLTGRPETGPPVRVPMDALRLLAR